MKTFLLSLIVAGAASLSPAQDALVSAAWLKENIADPKLVLFHVGGKASFEQDHIPGAQLVAPADLSIPKVEGALLLQLLPEDPLRQKIESLGVSDDSRVVVYFGNDEITQAMRVYFSLDAVGLGDRASVLDGGLPGWKAAGGALTAEVKPRTAGRITVRPHPELVASLDDVRAGLAVKNITLIDARTTALFDGSNPGSMARAGHIPGARSLPFANLTTEDLKMKTDPEIAEIFRTAGVMPGVPLVSYCNSGQQATLVYFAAKRLGLAARVYDGSWDEWSRRTDLPVEPAPIK
ncbi:MAG: sulfurtransferase [Vicinamibacteria bacterium]